MSDTTNERPGEAGVWFRGNEAWMVYHGSARRVFSESTRGIGSLSLVENLPDDGWSKAVPASELTTLQADCERWSAMYTKQADELVKLQLIVRERTHREHGCICEKCVDDEHQTAKTFSDVRSEVERLKARLAEVELKAGELFNTQTVLTASLSETSQRAEAAETRVKWQPIETAPKDWSCVILYYPDSGQNDDVMQGYYSCQDGGKDCWMDMVGDELEPTHWMPLPTPPATAPPAAGESDS